jgi:glycosyltransferase involved in cell wall biosynthesis
MLDAPRTPQVSVVIATRDRPVELARCIRSLRSQESDARAEIVVVDDGSSPPIAAADISGSDEPPVVVVRCEGIGPGRARNVGVARASADLILFTDDDTLPARTRVEAAYRFLTDHPAHVGVEGPTTSAPFDPLYAHSVSSAAPGSLLTCNVAYRRAAFDEVGGFAEGFPSPHAEDRDLGLRIQGLGPIGYVSAMTVDHPPKPITLSWAIRRGSDLVSDAYLYGRHPSSFPLARYLSAPGYAFLRNLKRWAYAAFRDTYQIRRSPTRAVRFAAVASGYTALGTVALMRAWISGRSRL